MQQFHIEITLVNENISFFTYQHEQYLSHCSKSGKKPFASGHSSVGSQPSSVGGGSVGRFGRCRCEAGCPEPVRKLLRCAKAVPAENLIRLKYISGTRQYMEFYTSHIFAIIILKLISFFFIVSVQKVLIAIQKIKNK